MPSVVSWKSAVFRFLAAQTVSLLGSSLVQYAIVWHIALTTSSGGMLTISTFCGFLPQIVLSLFAGPWIDRWDRKKLIMLADAVIACVTLALAIVFLLGQGNIWCLFAALIARSAGTGVQTPAVNAFIPQITPREQLMRINGVNSTLSSMTMFLSPVLGGAILALSGLEAALFVDVATAIVGIGITATVQARPLARPTDAGADGNAAGTPPTGGMPPAGGTLAFLKRNRFVGRLLAYQAVIMFLVSPSAFLTPLLVSRTFGPEVWRLTASEMTYSLGMTLGGLLVATWGGCKNRMRTTVAAGMAYGGIMIGLGLAPAFIPYLILNALIGVTSPLYNAPIAVSIQERIDASMHGRAFALMQTTTSCALPLGMLFFGPLADRIPVQWVLIASGCVIAPLSALAWGTNWFGRE